MARVTEECEATDVWLCCSSGTLSIVCVGRGGGGGGGTGDIWRTKSRSLASCGLSVSINKMFSSDKELVGNMYWLSIYKALVCVCMS